MQNANVDKTQQVTSTFKNASGDLQQEPVVAPHTLLFEYKKDDKTKIFPFHQDVDATWVRIDVVGKVPQKLQVMCMAVRTHKPLHVGNYQVVGRDTELLNGFYDLKIGEDKRFDDRSRGWRDDSPGASGYTVRVPRARSDSARARCTQRARGKWDRLRSSTASDSPSRPVT